MKRHPNPSPPRTAAARALLAAGLLAASASCSGLKKNGGDTWDGGNPYADYDGSSTPLPTRDESYSFYGPGSGSVDRSQFAPVYFAFDSYSVAGGEASKIAAVASALQASSSNLIIAGFTDQVGTDEYNRVLGERRALAVRDSLLASGVDPSRIQTVSFGEDMPADPGNDSLNRRVEFGLVQ